MLRPRLARAVYLLHLVVAAVVLAACSAPATPAAPTSAPAAPASSPAAAPAAPAASPTTASAPAAASPAPAAASPAAVAASPAASPAAAPAASPSASPAAAAPAAAPAAVAVVAPTAAPAPPDLKRGGTIRAGLDSDVINLDPLRSTALVDRQVLYNIYDSLVTIDKDLKIIPALAENWEVSTDGKTYTFKLRQGVKFHDGTAFNAEAVRWNIDRELNDKNSRRKSEIDSIESTTVVDPSTIKFNLKAPFAPLLANLVDRAGMMVSPAAAQKGGEDFTRNPLGGGTGAFKFVSWKKDDNVTLEANKDYWRKDGSGGALPYADRLIYRPITDETVMLTNVKTGDIDATFSVPAKDVASLRTSTEVVYRDTPALAFGSFYLNNTKPPFDNKAARQAVQWAIDRDEIQQTVFYNIGTVAYGPIPPPVFAYDKDFKPFKYDPAKAKEILTAGGLASGITFTMKVVSGSPVNIQLAQLLKDQMSKAGITMEIQQLEFAKILADQDSGDYQASLIGWSGRIDPDGNTYNHFHTGGSFNQENYSSKAADDLLDKARATTTQAERRQLYRQFEQQIADDAAVVFLRHGAAAALTTPKTQNLTLYADQIMRFTDVWLK